MSRVPTVRSVTSTPAALRVEWANGEVSEFASLWLRDNRPGDRDLQNGQRLIDIADLPEDPRLRSAEVRNGHVVIHWDGESSTTSFDLGWLARHAAASDDLRPELRTRLWLDGGVAEAPRDFAWKPLTEVRIDPTARVDWLTRLLQDGIAFLTGVDCIEAGILDRAKTATERAVQVDGNDQSTGLRACSQS